MGSHSLISAVYSIYLTRETIASVEKRPIGIHLLGVKESLVMKNTAIAVPKNRRVPKARVIRLVEYL